MTCHPHVFVVDPDATIRKLIGGLAQMMNLDCEAFSSGQEFVESGALERSGCAILEVCIPDVNGLILQQQINEYGVPMPVVFLTSQASVALAVRAMRAGALNFIEKPFRENEMWDSIQEGVELDAQRREAWRHKRHIKLQVAQLSDREREMLKLISQGESKREMATALDVCVRTVELRRRQLMTKLELQSYLELTHFAILAVNGNSGGHNKVHALAEQTL